jgi:hypothetical protein
MRGATSSESRSSPSTSWVRSLEPMDAVMALKRHLHRGCQIGSAQIPEVTYPRCRRGAASPSQCRVSFPFTRVSPCRRQAFRALDEGRFRRFDCSGSVVAQCHVVLD